MKKTSAVTVILVLQILSIFGCSKKDTISNGSIQDVTLNTAQNNIIEGNIQTFYGNWIVSKEVAYSPVFALEDEEINEFVAEEIEFRVHFARFEDNVCEDPNYDIETLSKDDFSEQNRICLSDIGVDDESIMQVTIYDKDQGLWDSPFCIVYVKSEDILIINNGGVYFELKKR